MDDAVDAAGGAQEEPTEEDRIINELVGRGDGSKYEDPAFPASDSSLYNDPNRPPPYADEEPRATYGPHPWLRPEQFAGDTDYFKAMGADAEVLEGPPGCNNAWFQSESKAFPAGLNISDIVMLWPSGTLRSTTGSSNLSSPHNAE